MMKKKLITAILCGVCTLSFCAPAFASDAEAVVEQPNSPITRAHDIDYKSEVVKIETFQSSIEAGDQPRMGTKFSPPGGGFFWTDGGDKVQVSFSAYGGPFSLNLTAGSTTVGGTAGAVQISPYINQYCKLYVNRTIQAKTYAVYQRLPGATNWQFLHYRVDPEVIGRSFSVRLTE